MVGFYHSATVPASLARVHCTVLYCTDSVNGEYRQGVEEDVEQMMQQKEKYMCATNAVRTL